MDEKVIDIISIISYCLFISSFVLIMIRYCLGYYFFSQLSRRDIFCDGIIIPNKFGAISFIICSSPFIISIILEGLISKDLVVFIFIMPVLLFFYNHFLKILSTTAELKDNYLIIRTKKHIDKIPIDNIESVNFVSTDIPHCKCLRIRTYDSSFDFSQLDYWGIFDMYDKLKSLIEIE